MQTHQQHDINLPKEKPYNQISDRETSENIDLKSKRALTNSSVYFPRNLKYVKLLLGLHKNFA